MKRQSDTTSDTSRQAGAKIPKQPRDCGPHVDTWPILDEQVGDATTPKTDEHGNRRPQAPDRGTA